MPSFAAMKDSFLGSAKTGRGQINMMVIIVAFVLAIMTINTHEKCKNALDKKNPAVFTDDSAVKLMYSVAVIILILCILLFGYDLAIMFGLF